ncbi:MAG: hypothetical protein HOP28_00975 [Gemmatimonadales bacterium]|nr:hypothetical protein [Gemmatimonadales bacterium]
MRRVGLAVVAVAVAVAGCSGFKDAFTSHAETAARVGSRELKSARVAEIIYTLGGPSANPQASEAVAGIWVDVSLFADQLASGAIKTDSVTTARMVFPQLAEQRVSAWHDTIVARRPPVNEKFVDSTYAAGEIRVFQHILFMPGGTTAADTAKAKALANQVLPRAKSGDFGKLAAQYSGDGSKSDNGFLPPTGRGGYVPEFENAAWALAPGEVSGVITSAFGPHIIRRPPLDEARLRMQSHLTQMLTSRADSMYMVQLSERNGIKVKTGAAKLVRDAVTDLGAARKSRKSLATMKGGDFTVGNMVSWIERMSPQVSQQIKVANDSLLDQFVKTLAQNAALLREADSAKIEVSPQIYEAMALQYKAQISNLKEALAMNGPEFSDSSKLSTSERRKLAGTKVDEYFDKLLKAQTQFRAVPPTLSSELRADGDYKIYPAGVARAGELVLARTAADSAAAATWTPPGGLQAAPGGPPVPAAPADTTKKP